MRTDRLLLQHMPALSIPYRFFLSAPLFGILGALLLLHGGEASWTNRWTAETLAATHLLTLGFMATVMVGALFQVLPVLSGHSVPGQRWLAPGLHILLAASTLALATSFLLHSDPWRLAALLLLAVTFALFLGALGLRLVKPGGGDSVFGIRLAALSLFIAVALGMLMLWVYMGGHTPQWLQQSGGAHLRFALLGWVLLLVMAVSYQVIPMFHVTPEFPKPLARAIPACVFIALVLLTAGSKDRASGLAVALLVSSGIAYAAITLSLFRRRKRKLVDYTIRFWQLGLACLIVALLGYGAAYARPEWSGPASQLQWGVLLVVGFAISIIIGMLQKIAPFLAWLHLQQACLTQPSAMLTLPTMHDLLPRRRARVQFWLHGTSLALLTMAPAYPPLGLPAALALAVDFAWLELSLLKVLRAYRGSLDGINRL